MAKKYYWLKLQKDFFKRHDIRIIEDMPNGKDYILFYMKLLVESISHEGSLRFNETIPYNEQMLSTITNTNIDIVRSAVKIFSELGLMDYMEDGTLFMNEVQSMMGVETEWAKKKAEYRKRKKLELSYEELPKKYPYMLGECEVTNSEHIIFPNGTSSFVDEKRYGGNGKLALARSNGNCEHCGNIKSDDTKLVIHHNNGYSNEIEDLIVLCTKCHGQIHGQKEDMSDKSKIKSIELEKDIEKELNKPVSTKPKKHKYGEYNNILLTDNQYSKLLDEWGEEKLLFMIVKLDEGIQMKGYKYKDHNLTIRSWEKNTKFVSSKEIEREEEIIENIW